MAKLVDLRFRLNASSLGRFAITQSKDVRGISRTRVGIDLAEVGDCPVSEIVGIDQKALWDKAASGELFELCFASGSPRFVCVVNLGAADLTKPRVIFLCEPEDGESPYCHGHALSLRSDNAMMTEGEVAATRLPGGAA